MEQQFNKNKLIMPITILLASIILGGFYYASQINKQKSIERQQEIKIEEDKKAEDAKQQAVDQQQQKEYVAKRRNDCLQVYKTENQKWNNVDSYEYKENNDNCSVLYASQEKQKSKEECDKMSKSMIETGGEGMKEASGELWIDCMNNVTRKNF